ncbi:MAG: 6-bladed beta-propeller [Gemmatimonadetes bacterium]|nr:6-bladed beta-propeller [Gemmatimonadota bacterium]
MAERDSAGVVIIEISGDAGQLPVRDLTGEPLFEIRGEDAPHLGRVGEVEFLSDGRLLVEDNQTRDLHRFSATGALEKRVGRAGEGPGEFQNLTELTAGAGDTVYAYDRRLYRITILDPAGNLVRVIPLTRENGGFGSLAMDAWPLDGGRLLLHPVITTGRGRMVWGDALTYRLTVAGPDLEPLRIIVWPGWEAPLGEAEIREVRDSMDASIAPLRAQRPDVARDYHGGRLLAGRDPGDAAGTRPRAHGRGWPALGVRVPCHDARVGSGARMARPGCSGAPARPDCPASAGSAGCSAAGSGCAHRARQPGCGAHSGSANRHDLNGRRRAITGGRRGECPVEPEPMGGS